MFKKVTEAEFQTIGATIPACSVVPSIYKQSKKHTVTYHFSNLQEVYNDNCQIHTKCQLQYLHSPHLVCFEHVCLLLGYWFNVSRFFLFLLLMCWCVSRFLLLLSFQPLLHDWCNKGRGMCNPVCGMVHIKEPLQLIGKSSPCIYVVIYNMSEAI